MFMFWLPVSYGRWRWGLEVGGEVVLETGFPARLAAAGSFPYKMASVEKKVVTGGSNGLVLVDIGVNGAFIGVVSGEVEDLGDRHHKVGFKLKELRQKLKMWLMKI